jgi:hypothetical protein
MCGERAAGRKGTQTRGPLAAACEIPKGFALRLAQSTAAACRGRSCASSVPIMHMMHSQQSVLPSVDLRSGPRQHAAEIAWPCPAAQESYVAPRPTASPKGEPADVSRLRPGALPPHMRLLCARNGSPHSLTRALARSALPWAAALGPCRCQLVAAHTERVNCLHPTPAIRHGHCARQSHSSPLRSGSVHYRRRPPTSAARPPSPHPLPVLLPHKLHGYPALRAPPGQRAARLPTGAPSPPALALARVQLVSVMRLNGPACSVRLPAHSLRGATSLRMLHAVARPSRVVIHIAVKGTRAWCQRLRGDAARALRRGTGAVLALPVHACTRKHAPAHASMRPSAWRSLSLEDGKAGLRDAHHAVPLHHYTSIPLHHYTIPSHHAAPLHAQPRLGLLRVPRLRRRPQPLRHCRGARPGPGAAREATSGTPFLFSAHILT